MIRAAFAAVFFTVLSVATAPAGSNAGNRAVAYTHGVPPAPPGVLWSTLGVHADSDGTTGNGTDDSAALNSLPTNQVIIGDCPHPGKGVRLAGQFQLQSNLTLYINPGCKLYCDWYTVQQGVGCIGQANLRAPISNVLVQGIDITNVTTNFAFKGKALSFWIETLTFRYNSFKGFWAWAYVRGCDQEWGWQSFTNSPGGGGNTASGTATDGFRHYGNYRAGGAPPCATTGGKPQNIWLHDSTVLGTGDGAIQVGPACQPDDKWYGVNSDGYLYENNVASGANGNMILLGLGAQGDVVLQCINTFIQNVTIRNITGATQTTGIRVQAANGIGSGNFIQNVVFQNITIDSSPKTSGGSGGAAQFRAYDGSVMTNIAINGVRSINNFGTCLDIGGSPSSTGIVVDGMVCDVPRATSSANAIVRSTTGTTIKNSTLPSRSGGGVQLGPPPNLTNPLLNRINSGTFTTFGSVLLNNAVGQVANGRTGIVIGNANSASVTGNTVSPKAGNNNAVGISLQLAASDPGTTNSTVTGNTLAGIGTPVICASGQGNTVQGCSP